MKRIWLNNYEKEVPHSLDYPDIPLHAILSESAKRFPEKTSVIFYKTLITYSELNDLTNRFANALNKLGIKSGDRVAIMLPNLPQAVISYYGTLKMGAIAVQTNPLYVERELEEQLADSGAETIIALDIFYPRIENIKKRTPLKNIVLTGVQDYLPLLLKLLYPIKARKEGQWIKVKRIPPIYDFVGILRESDVNFSEIMVEPDDIALLQYTGGTTGIPKAVMLTHRNLVTNVYQCRRWMWDLKEGEENILSVIPFFHVYGMTVCMNLSILLGSAMILLPKFKTIDVLKAIDRYRPSAFPGVQAMYVAINNYPNVDSFNISSIRACISGAGPLALEVQEEFERLTGGRVVEGYGLTEASPVTHANPIYGKRKKGSIGIPFPDTDARVIDMKDGEKVLPVGEVGELQVRGTQVMKGYWNRQDETDAVLKDGWLSTGDMAKMDEEGYFYIVDRKKDMIKTVGENVYPREIEEVLYRYPKIKEAVIVGIPEKFSSEIIKAYIVLKEGESATENEIIEFCRENLAKFKVPKMIEFREELPKTMIGKVLRRKLLEEEMKNQ